MTKIIIWGLGRCFPHVYYETIRMWGEDSVIALIDNNKMELDSNKYPVKIITPEEIGQYDYDFIIVSMKKPDSILAQAESIGIPSKKIHCFWNRENDLYLSLLEEETMDLRLKYNNQPFEIENSIKHPIVKSGTELLKKVYNSRCSLSRFGDGEFEIMLGRNRAWFENASDNLITRLFEVLRSQRTDLIVALADDFGNLDKYTDEAAQAIREYDIRSRDDIYKQIIDFDRVYYDAYVSRPYMMYKDKSYAVKIFSLFKRIWKDRHICIVEGKYARSGVNNDLFDGAKGVERVICPPEKAFSRYDEILSGIVEHISKERLILISLGPTATVLAYDLCAAGYQAIDIGQLDNEYDWFKMGATARVDIPGKQVAEYNLEVVQKSFNDEAYNSQIVLDVS